MPGGWLPLDPSLLAPELATRPPRFTSIDGDVAWSNRLGSKVKGKASMSARLAWSLQWKYGLLSPG